MSLTEGKFIVTVTDYGITETKGGKPQVYVMFSNGAKWWGSLSDLAKPWTAKNLVTLGFAGADLKELNYPGAIPLDHSVEIVLMNDTYEGKTTLKTKYINSLTKKVSEADSVALLSGVDLGADLALERKEAGVELRKTVKPMLVKPSVDITTEEIPF